MNDESEPSGGPVPPYQDLDRLRRSTTDRYIAGVAGGLGRHFGIDPVVVRVLLAVLTVFGGAGVLVYAACWLFVPEDGSDHAVIDVAREPRRIVLLVAAAVAVLAAVGDAFSGFSAGWPVAAVAVILAVVLIARERRHDTWHSLPAPGADQATGQPDQATGQTDQPTGQPGGSGPAEPAAPPWSRRRRSGVVWFWPTLALIAIGLGILGLVDATTAVPAAAYPALALAITGGMLLLGAFVGRPGGLILIGLICTVLLTVVQVLGGIDVSTHRLDVAPATAAQVQPEYRVHNGRISLDLSALADPQALSGRTVTVRLNAGRIVVTLPRGVPVDVDAKLDLVGGIQAPGYDDGGFGASLTRLFNSGTVNSGTANSGTIPPLELRLRARVGQITVEQP